MIKSKLKIMLATREMTQKELAQRTGVRPPTISAIATNTIKEVPISVLDKICKELNCNVGDLFEYVEDQRVSIMKVDLQSKDKEE